MNHLQAAKVSVQLDTLYNNSSFFLPQPSLDKYELGSEEQLNKATQNLIFENRSLKYKSLALDHEELHTPKQCRRLIMRQISEYTELDWKLRLIAIKLLYTVNVDDIYSNSGIIDQFKIFTTVEAPIAIISEYFEVFIAQAHPL